MPPALPCSFLSPSASCHGSCVCWMWQKSFTWLSASACNVCMCLNGMCTNDICSSFVMKGTSLPFQRIPGILSDALHLQWMYLSVARQSSTQLQSQFRAAPGCKVSRDQACQCWPTESGVQCFLLLWPGTLSMCHGRSARILVNMVGTLYADQQPAMTAGGPEVTMIFEKRLLPCN